MGGVFLSQSVSGAIIDLFPKQGEIYPIDAYRAVFGLQAIFLLLACLMYLRAHDPRRQNR
jgi:hypothetical protein